MTLDLPFWIKQRQINVDEVATGTYRLSGPNLPEAVVGIRMTDDLRWQAWLREKVDGPEVAASVSTYDNAREAIGVAFEMYREHYVN
jgi:hypothetical protein